MKRNIIDLLISTFLIDKKIIKIYFSCDPNCVTETVELADTHIIIFANRRVNRGEELSYDYKVNIIDLLA